MIASEVIAAAKAAHAKWDVWASVSLAQYGIESAWGRFEPPGSNNGFGIQALPGLPFVESPSHEFRNGRMVPVYEKFAVFANVADAFDEHAKLLASNPVYAPAMAAHSADEFAYALTGRYATAPNYGGALVALMKADDLYQYDDPYLAPPVVLTPRSRPIATVAELQAALNTAGAIPALAVDGKFGVLTRAALTAFQKRAGLDPDGDFGPLTSAALTKAVELL